MSDHDQIFDFFGLPRGLRNNIYGLLTRDVVIAQGSDAQGYPNTVRIQVQDGPFQQLLHLNHQFKAEYEQEIKRFQTILFRDLGSAALERPSLPPALYVEKAEFTIISLCLSVGACRDGDHWDMSCHLDWITSSVTSLSNLKALKIKAYPQWISAQYLQPHDSHDTAMLGRLDRLTKMAKVTRIEVYPLRAKIEALDLEKRTEAYEKHEGLKLVWTKQSGWQELE